MDSIHYTFLILILTIALFIWDKLRADRGNDPDEHGARGYRRG